MSHQNISPNGSDPPPPYQTAALGGSLQTNKKGTTGTEKDINITCSAKGYEDGLRKNLEVKTENKLSFSFWNIFKSAVIQGFSTPATFNEPLSQLQRHAEDLEYAELLNAAVDLEDSVRRMVYVAIFVCSKYASASELYSRAFNPLLGETYEYVDPEKGYRYLSEQVSHHPPVLAAWAESSRWTYYGESATQNTIHHNSLEVDHAGTCYLTLRLSDGTEDMYTWRKPTAFSKMHLISGSPTIESYGPTIVENWTTRETCTVDGFRVGSGSRIQGKVVDGNRRRRAELSGSWNEAIIAHVTPDFHGQHPNAPEKKDEKDVKDSDSGKLGMIWESNRQRIKKGDYAPFLAGLNDLPDKLKAFLPPTDSRLRPDQRAIENEQHEFADAEKKRLEEQQRERQVERDEAGLGYKPRWFNRQKHGVTGEEYWSFDGEYWTEREKNNGERWHDVGNIF
ncbi:Oxysterol-binding protein [Acephala macrosclerotiorum]|nr:Oxysterol-binding protein [Acephala macrosclerotiorum]